MKYEVHAFCIVNRYLGLKYSAVVVARCLWFPQLSLLICVYVGVKQKCFVHAVALLNAPDKFEKQPHVNSSRPGEIATQTMQECQANHLRDLFRIIRN